VKKRHSAPMSVNIFCIEIGFCAGKIEKCATVRMGFDLMSKINKTFTIS